MILLLLSDRRIEIKARCFPEPVVVLRKKLLSENASIFFCLKTTRRVSPYFSELEMTLTLTLSFLLHSDKLVIGPHLLLSPASTVVKPAEHEFAHHPHPTADTRLLWIVAGIYLAWMESQRSWGKSCRSAGAKWECAGQLKCNARHVARSMNCFGRKMHTALKVSDGWLPDNASWQTVRMRKMSATRCSVHTTRHIPFNLLLQDTSVLKCFFS